MSQPAEVYDLFPESICNDDESTVDSDEQYTPKHIIDKARIVLGGIIDFDPASSFLANRVVKASRYFNKSQNALAQPEEKWFGNTWINPPYSRGNPEAFYSRLVAAYKAGRIPAFCGIHNIDTSAGWYSILSEVVEIECYLSERVSFSKAGQVRNSNPRPQFLFYAGKNAAEFMHQFHAMGHLRAPIRYTREFADMWGGQ